MAIITTDPVTGDQTTIMQWRYYADADGRYIGRWDVDDADKPSGGEVLSSPPNEGYRWNRDYSRWELPASEVRKTINDVQQAEAIEQMMEEVRATLDYLRSLGADIKRRTPGCRNDYATLTLTDDISGSALVIAQSAGASDAFVDNGKLYANVQQPVLDAAAAQHDPVQGAVQARQSAIYTYAKRILDAAVADYSDGEMVVWADLEREARQYQSDGTIGMLLQREIDRGQRDAATLAGVVVAKADALHGLRTSVIANRTYHCNAVQSMANNGGTVSDVQAYDYLTGWGI